MTTRTSDFVIFDQKLREDRAFWIRHLADVVNPAQIRLDLPRPEKYSATADEVEMAIDGDVCSDLFRLTGQGPFLLYVSLVTALKIVLFKYTQRSLVVTGSPARRPEKGSAPQTNALAIVDQISGDLTIRELLMRVRGGLLDSYAHQRYGFDRLLRDLGLERVENRCPLFDVAISLNTIHCELPTLANDITLSFDQVQSGLRGKITYRTALFRRGTIERLANHYNNVLRILVGDTSTRIADVNVLSDEETRTIVTDWNRTAAGRSSDASTPELFQAVAAATPDAIALTSPGKMVTYGELNRRSNRLARALRRLGVIRESCVGISVKDRLEMVIGILAILKSGAAFLPLDPDHPAERRNFMLEDSGSSVVVTDWLTVEGLPAGVRALNPCGDQGKTDRESDEGIADYPAPDNLAYVIYTSGSTGKPKGVMVTHQGLCNLALAQSQPFGARPDSRVLQFASFSFDASVSEVFVTLLAGATLCLASEGALHHGATLLKTLLDERVSMVTLPPSVLSILPETEAPALQTLIVAGESCPVEIARRWSRGRRFLNAYGPTEITVCATIAECQESETRPPIGRPIANTQVYLLNLYQQLVPVGVPGEICAGGLGVTRGYLNRPELTAERFIPDTFSQKPGGRMYRTGDLACYRPDGIIDFLGRIDQQLKIRGARIEPAEIEAEIRSHPAIRDAVVIAWKSEDEDARLIAYTTSASENRTPPRELRTFLRGKLPDYMIPSIFIPLDSLPLSSSGKVDRGALPTPDPQVSSPESVSTPRTTIEEVLAEIWAQLLGKERVGRDDDFFELGGHSLLATQLLSRILDSFRIELPLRGLFEAPTVAALAQMIEETMRGGAGIKSPPIVNVGRKELLPLSFAQRRLWFLHRLEPESPVYNSFSALRLKGRFDVTALESGLSEILRRHESLRTTFVEVDGHPSQAIAPPQRLSIEPIDLSAMPEAERELELERQAAAECRRPFDLSAGPLLRVKVWRLGADDHAVTLTMHHIICDGWSMGLLSNELWTLYEGHQNGEEIRLPELPIQYGDFAVWQRNWLQGEILESHLSYWKQQLRPPLPVLRLPADRPRPVIQTYRGAAQSFSFSESLTAALKRLSRLEGVTLYMTLLAGFDVLLHRYSGQQDIIVGTPIANRTRVETERLIGFFVNTLLLRADLSGNPSFRQLLARIREVTLGAYTYQDMPFERLVEELQPERDLSLQPLFQVVFTLQSAPKSSHGTPGINRAPWRVENNTTPFDLVMNLWDAGQTLTGSLEYSTDLFNPETIARLLRHFERLLHSAAGDADLRIGELEMLSEEERRLLRREIEIDELRHGFSFGEGRA